jgi:hypothetical protein
VQRLVGNPGVCVGTDSPFLASFLLQGTNGKHLPLYGALSLFGCFNEGLVSRCNENTGFQPPLMVTILD